MSDTINPNKNILLFKLASLSPTANNALDLELYRVNAESDEADLDFILTLSVTHLLKDLEEIGILVAADAVDFSDDLVRLSQFLDVAELLLPNGLYPLLKTDSRLRTLIRHIVEGSVGSGDLTITAYLDELAALDGGVPHRPHLVEAIDRLAVSFNQTEVFSDYLKNILDLQQEEKITTAIDDERMIAYHRTIKELIGRLSDAVNLFEDDPDYQDILKIQNACIFDFLAPDNLIAYTYLFLENSDTLPPELIEAYQRKWYHYKVSHRWCYDYYQLRKETELTHPYRVILSCVAYAFSLTKDGYAQSSADLQTDHPDPHIDRMIESLFMLKE